MTTAKEIQAARRAGLLLCGVEDDKPQWLGTGEQWMRYGAELRRYEEQRVHLSSHKYISPI